METAGSFSSFLLPADVNTVFANSLAPSKYKKRANAPNSAILEQNLIKMCQEHVGKHFAFVLQWVCLVQVVPKTNSKKNVVCTLHLGQHKKDSVLASLAQAEGSWISLCSSALRMSRVSSRHVFDCKHSLERPNAEVFC